MNVSEYRERSAKRLEQSGNAQPTRSGGQVTSVSQYRENSKQRYERSHDRQYVTSTKQTQKTNSYINSFLKEANNFFTAAEGEINKGFDAAEFFERRKATADSLKKKASIASQYLDNYADSYDQEDYNYLREYLNNFDTQVDEVMGYYQPAVTAKTGMRAYEDEILASMEKQKKYGSLLDSVFNNPHMASSPIAGIYNAFRMIPSDTSYQAVTDQWTDEQRYQLGLAYSEDPAKARKYAVEVNQGRDPLEAYKKSEGMKTADITALQAEVDRLQAEYDALRNRTEYTATTAEGRMQERSDLYDELKRRKQELTEKNSYLTQAKRIQEGIAYNDLKNNADFAEKSVYTSTEKYPVKLKDPTIDYSDPVYEYINNTEGVRDQVNRRNNVLANKGYDLLTEDEVGIYNYVHATQGEEAALAYLDNMQDILNQRIAERDFLAVQGKTAKELLFGVGVGLSQFVSNIQSLINFNDDYIPNSPNAYLGQMIREDLADNGANLPIALGGASLGQLGYDVISTAANMAPSLAVGALVNPTAGAALMGASAAGGAYQEALNDGYSKEQARMYSLLVGASEAGMEKILGGFGEIGGELTKGITRKLVGGVENAIARAALELGGSMISEGFEEGLQEVITPWIKNLTLLTDEDVNWEEVAYSTLLGALSVLPTEGPKSVVNAYRYSRAGSSAGGSTSAAPIATSGKERAVQISTDQEVDIGDFDTIDEKGHATVKTSNGAVDINDISFPTETAFRRYNTVLSLPGIDAATANEVLHYLNENGGAEDTDSIIGIRDSYGRGYYNRVWNPHGTDAGLIDHTLSKKLYQIGKDQAAARAEQSPTTKAPKAEVKPSEGYKKVVFEGKVAELKGKKEASVKLMDFISENFSGTTVHVFESYKRGKKRYYRDNAGVEHEAPNGQYVDDEIWIDLNAGNKGEGLSLNTFGHEMYHHVEKWNKKGAQDLAAFLLRELGEKTSIDQAIQNQMAKARAAGYGEKHFMDKGYTRTAAENMVYDRAVSDLVADSLEAVFTHGDPAGALAKLRSEDQGLFDQIKTFVDEWVTKLRAFLKGGTISEEGKIVANLEKFEQIQQMLMEAMDAAGQNYAEAVASLTPGEEGVVVNENGEPVAMLDEDGSTMLSIIEGHRNSELPEIVNEIEKSLPRTEAEIEEVQVEQAEYDLEQDLTKRIENLVDQIRNSMGRIMNMDSVGKVTGSNAVKYTGDRKTDEKAAAKVFKTQGGLAYRPGFGKVHLSKRGIIHSIFHGNGPAKQASVPAIKAVVENGIEIYRDPNHKGRGYETVSFAAPIDFLGKKSPLIVVVKTVVDENSDKTLYIHEICDADGNYIQMDSEDEKNSSTSVIEPTSTASTAAGENAPISNVAQTTSEVNTGMYSLRNSNQDNSIRGILSRIDVESRKTLAEREHLGRYQERLEKLSVAEARLADIQAKMAENPDKKELNRLKNQEHLTKEEISNLKKRLNALEKTDLFKKMVAEQRYVEYREQQKAKFDAQAEEYRQVRKQLTGADSVISIMEDEFVRLAKDLEEKKIDIKAMEEEFIRLGKEYDKLRNAYDKKTKTAKDRAKDNATWQREFKRLMQEYDTAEQENQRLMNKYDTAVRKSQRLEETILRQRQRAKEKVQNRRATEMRHKIERRVGELEKMLLNGSKTSYVLEALRGPVADILDALDMRKSNYYLNRLASLDRKIAKEQDPQKRAKLMDERDAFEEKGDTVARHMLDLKRAYDNIRKDADPTISSIYDEGLSDHLDNLIDVVGDTRLGDMTKAQLDAVYDIITAVLETVRNANKAFVEGKRQLVSEMSENAMREVRSIGGEKNKGKTESDFVKGLKAFMWNDMRPVDIFETIGSGQLKELFSSIRKGEDTWATDIREAREFFRQQWQKHNGQSWDMDKEYTFKSASGMEFKLNTEQIMSMYALFRRDKGQAMDHLRKGGFVFDNTVVDKKGRTHSDATAYNLTDDTIMQIIGTLTKDQRAFVEAMQGYLSDTMGAKGNEVSMKLYGIKLFREKNYFPLRSAKQYMERAKAQQDRENPPKLKNAGFTKPVTEGANTAIVLSPFLSAWGSHVDEMSNYHAFVLPMEDMYRVYNYHTDVTSEESATRSVQAAIQNAYGEGAVKAIDQLLKDINGGVRSDSTAGVINKMISKYKKGATMASLSVAVQQPSAILRAAGMIDAKYLVGPKPTSKTTERTWEEIKRYAPIATIKEIGSFDTNTGRTATQFLTGMEYNGFNEKFQAFFKDGEFRDEMLGRLPAFMDEVSWSVIWNSVKREQAAKNPGMDTTSEAFMKKVAERFTDVIVHTQVYDSVLAKNAMMRSKDTGMKMVTAFMAEPTVTANMIAGALLNWRRTGDKKALVKTLSSIVAATVVNAAAVSVVYALRDDDEEERLDEKWIASFRENLLDSANPMGYIPVLRDVQSVMQGYDVERPDMSVVSDFADAMKSLTDEDISGWEKAEKSIGAVMNAFGVPAKNVIRDAKGIYNTLSQAYGVDNKATSTGYRMAWRGEKLDNGEQLLLAIQSGDNAHMERVASRFEDMDKAMGGLMTAIRRQYVEGIMDANEAKELLMTYNELTEDEVYWKLQEWEYVKANGTGEGYTKMGDLMAAVASGDGLEEQIQRYRDNGMEDSEIRSQISKVYRQQYLEADEAGRTDIQRVVGDALRATGSTDTDIRDKFKGWDFEAEYGMTYNDMIDGYREGEVTRLQLRDAMEFYGLKNFEINEKLSDLDGDIAFHRQYGMSLNEMKELYGEGDITRNQMVSALVYSGKSRNEAQEMVTQMDIQNRTGIAYSKLDDAYRAGDISRNTLYNAMIDNGATRDEADEAIIGYDWLKRNASGDKDLSITDAKKFAVSIGEKAEGETLADYGVSISAYKEYKARVVLCKGVDANGDGKTDDGTLRDEILRMIDSLPISDTAKDGLALLRYSRKSIQKNAPWH